MFIPKREVEWSVASLWRGSNPGGLLVAHLNPGFKSGKALKRLILTCLTATPQPTEGWIRNQKVKDFANIEKRPVSFHITLHL